MKFSEEDINFLKWESLPFSKKQDISNHYWNPYKPEVGASLKQDIVNSFIKSTSIDALQYGIGSFGWEVYLLFVIVENPKIRVPRKFSDISINKGVVKEWIDKNHARVKFNYGGTFIINLEEKIVIR